MGNSRGLKKLVRQRMQNTGETYTAALWALRQAKDAPMKPDPAVNMMTLDMAGTGETAAARPPAPFSASSPSAEFETLGKSATAGMRQGIASPKGAR